MRCVAKKRTGSGIARKLYKTYINRGSFTCNGSGKEPRCSQVGASGVTLWTVGLGVSTV